MFRSLEVDYIGQNLMRQKVHTKIFQMEEIMYEDMIPMLNKRIK